MCGTVLPAGLSSAIARGNELIDENDPQAKKLGYRHDAQKVDTRAFPKRGGDRGARQFCDNCALFAGEPGDRSAACSIFNNRLVAGKGWCAAWVARS